MGTGCRIVHYRSVTMTLPVESHSQSNQSSRGGRILVIDDSRSALSVITSVLEEGGFEVKALLGGREILDVLRDFDPDLVILDILMPDPDGLEVCRRIRTSQLGWDGPILFLTGDDGREAQAAAIRAGGDDLVRKASFHSELLIRVKSLLRIRHLHSDLTHERDTLRETQRQRELLQRFIVHDLKSPLQAIRLNAEMIFENPDEPSGIAEPVTRIHEFVKVMERMVQDILDISRCDSGALQADPWRFVLEPQVRQWINEVSLEFQRKNQRLRVDIPEGLVLDADAALLRRCLLNLLNNSSKYSPSGSEIRVEVDCREGAVLLRVRDQGPGIPEEMRDRIFDPFFRLDRDSEQARVSSGLGLAFCRSVAEVHSGRIWVESNEPVGAVFCLELPISIPVFT
jgi:two-component system, sensor histidine kinase and response regulator